MNAGTISADPKAQYLLWRTIFRAIALIMLSTTFSGCPARTESKVAPTQETTPPPNQATVPTAEVDEYAGCENCGIATRKSKFFRIEKINGRWWLIDPGGRPLWMRSVQNIDDGYFRTSKYSSKGHWATEVKRRLREWGFNTIGEYAANAVVAQPPGMPYLRLIRPAWYSTQAQNLLGCIKEPVKNLVDAVPKSVYDDYRGTLIDAYDPRWAVFAHCLFIAENGGMGQHWNVDRRNDPFLIGWVIDDGDQYFGVSGGGPRTTNPKPHPGWLILVARSTLDGYSDNTVYSKTALRDFLKTRYNNDLSALNTAWWSSYTSWDHNGTWQGGTGLLDEGGQHKWVCRKLPCSEPDWYTLNSMSPAAQKDLDDFLYQFTNTMVSAVVKAIRSEDANHLIIGPDTFNSWGILTRQPALKALGENVDVIHSSFSLANTRTFPERLNTLRETYDLTGRPIIVWIGFTANPDSAMQHYPNPWGSDPTYAHNQSRRGQFYAMHVNSVIAAQGHNGDFPVIGLDWWAWGDMSSENANWGLVSARDNAYDGREAVQTSVPCSPPVQTLSCGGENANYGDFLSWVRVSNLGIYCKIMAQSCRSITPAMRP